MLSYSTQVRQCFRIYVVITNLYRTPSLGGGRFMICTRYAQPLVGTLFCRVALGQSSLMGRWVHSPNLFYNWIVDLCDTENDLLFGMLISVWFTHRNDTIIFDMIMTSLLKWCMTIISVGVAARQNDYKKRKLEKRQVKSLKLSMGELRLAALWQVLLYDKWPTYSNGKWYYIFLNDIGAICVLFAIELKW